MLGQVIHGYRVDRVLSADKGGFGEVFLATHVESGAEAVVKVLRAEMSANHDTVTRFFNEARAAASIHHPGIVAIHNVGYHGDRAYLLMERLRGEDLETRLKAGPLPLDRALVFMRQTAGAIAAAHERGIVHRDLKPANLFVVRDPDVAGGERIKVLDFGIAKLGGGVNPGTTQGVFGTPMYMSPEQCANTGAVDHRSDLYSLGCIFYELATGRPPFGRGGVELIAAHLRDAPVPPRAIAPAVPPAVEALILSLLEKDPAHRMQSCAALVRALEGAAANVGISLGAAQSVPPGGIANAAPTTPMTMATARRGRGAWIAVAVVVVAGAGVAIALSTRGGDQTATKTPPPVAAAIDAAPAPVPVPSPSPSPSPDHERAAALIDEGKKAMFAGQYEAGADKFRQAVAIEPNALGYLDLAVADYQTGAFGDSLVAIKAALAHGPTDREVKVLTALRAKVTAEMQKQGMTPPPD